MTDFVYWRTKILEGEIERISHLQERDLVAERGCFSESVIHQLLLFFGVVVFEGCRASDRPVVLEDFGHTIHV